MNNILVTGGCGFIGGHLVDQLKANYPKAKIVVVDDLRTPGNHVVPDVKYYHKSIQDKELFEILLFFEFSFVRTPLSVLYFI